MREVCPGARLDGILSDMATEEETELAELEEEIRRIEGVIGAVVFNDVAANPVEIQVFTRSGTAEHSVRRQISGILSRRGMFSSAERVFVFELAGVGGGAAKVGTPNVEGARRLSEEEPASPAEPATPHELGRPRLGGISLTSSGQHAQASVSLVFNGREAEGIGHAANTPYGLRLTAATTLEAVQALLEKKGLFSLEGVALMEVLEQQVVLVLVETTLGGGRLLLGSSLLAGSPAHEATVRATLDAVNRQLELSLAG